MSIESAPLVRQTRPEYTTRFTTLLALVSGFTMAYGAMLHAEDPSKTSKSPASKHNPEPLADVRKIVDITIPELNHTLYPVREKAQLRIKQAIREALERQNPLPETLKKSFVVPYESGGTIETFKRMANISEFTAELEEELPGRIAAPDADTTLTMLLEDQFHCRMRAEDPVLRAKLEDYKIGAEGEKSGSAFVRMCRDLDAIPIPTTDGFLLRPIQDGEEFRASDTMGLVTIGGPKIQYREAFLLPDKGVILSLIDPEKKTEEEEQQEMTRLFFAKPEDLFTEPTPTKTINAPLVSWSKDEGQQTPKEKMWTPLSQKKFNAMTARKPVSYALPTAQTKLIPAGLQSFCIPSAPEQQPDGTWVTIVKGMIWECVEWPVTTNEEDMFSYQLVAANRLHGITKDGRRIDATVSDLHFCKRDLSFSVQTMECPSVLHIRAFTDMQKEEITLP